MVRGKGINPMTGVVRPLNIGELDDIKGMKSEAEATLKHLDSTNTDSGIDKGKLKREIERYDAILHEGEPKKVAGINKDRLYAEAQKLKEEMQKNMPTREEMDFPAKNPGAVQKHLKWISRNKENKARFKEIMRTIEPDDPTATNVDKLRREK